jgi:hypothetical protein
MNDYHCLICEKPLTPKVYHDSVTHHDVPLCFPHQRMIDESRATPPAMKLYFALRTNKVPVILEYQDGLQTIDIALPGQLYIEVEGPYYQDADQALADLLTTIFSVKESIPTIRIPNSLILDEYRFKKAVARIVEMCSGLKKAS